MTRRLASALLAGTLLLGVSSGCRTPSPTPPTAPVAGPDPKAVDAELDRRARAHAAFATGVVRQMQEDPEEMLRLWTQSLESDPGNVGLALEVARRRLARKDFAAAISVLEKTRHAVPPNASVESLLGLAYLQVDRREDAVAAYRQALTLDPGEWALYSTMARILIQASHPDEALNVIHQAMDRPGAAPGLLLELAEILGQLEQHDPKMAAAARTQALVLLDRVAAFAPKDPQILTRLAERNAALGRKDLAEKFYQESRTQAPRNPLAAARLAEMYLQSGRLKEATEQLEALRRDDPTNPAPLYFLGLVAFEEHDYERAADYFQRSLLLNPEAEATHLDLLSALLSSGKAAEALAAAQHARTKIKPGFRLEFLTALAYGRLKQYDQAYESFRAAEAIAKETDPKLIDHRFLFQVGAVLSEAHKEELAIEYLEKSLALQPDFGPALNHLGYLWADKGSNLDQALKMIEQAVKLEPANAAYVDSLGWVLFRLGRPAEALPQLERAIELLAKEPDATVYEHLGDVLAALKRPAEARAAWEKSLALEATDAVKQKLESTPK